jgi:spermidine/putrescine transport system permease protein
MQRIREGFLYRLNYFLSFPALLWQVVFLWLPLMILIGASVYSRTHHFSLIFYKEILTAAHLRIILRSLSLAFFNACCCLVVSYPVAYFVAFHTRRWKNILVLLLTLPFWVNFLVHVYAWFFILERNGLVNSLLLSFGLIRTPLHLMNTLFSVALVMFQVYLPFMLLPLYVIFEKFDVRLIEASLDLGASWRQTFWQVMFPLTLSGARLGFFLVLGMSFGDYVTPQLLSGSKTLFVGTVISDYFILNRSFATGAAFMCVSALVLIGVMGACFVWLRAMAKGVK